MSLTVKLKDIIDGMEMQMDEASHYLDLKTGEVVFVKDEEMQYAEDDDIDEDDFVPDWQKPQIELAKKILNMEMIETITAWEPNKWVAMDFEAGEMYKTDDIHFSYDGSSTTINNNATCRGTSYITKCMFPYFKGMFKKIDREMLEDFKKMAEK